MYIYIYSIQKKCAYICINRFIQTHLILLPSSSTSCWCLFNHRLEEPEFFTAHMEDVFLGKQKDPGQKSFFLR